MSITVPPVSLARLGVGSRRVAVLRVLAGLLVAYQGWVWGGLRLPPPELRFFPTFADLHLPVNQPLIHLAAAAAVVGGLCVAVGWYHRVWAWVAAAGFTYLGWLTAYTGKVNHSHHLLWFLILVAVAPAASAWAIRRDPVRGSARWAHNGFSVILGLIYFGAGWAKLKGAGLEWGTQLVTMLDVINGQKGLPGAPDWLRGTPWLATAMGTGALAFELLFLPLLVWPKTRKWVWPAGLVFHWLTWWLMDISFWTLQVFYLVFLPWGDGDEEEPTRLQARVTVGLVTLIAVFGLLGVEAGWPFASYPSFEGPFTGEQVVVLADGVPVYEVGGDTAHAVNAVLSGKADVYAEWLGVESVVLVVD